MSVAVLLGIAKPMPGAAPPPASGSVAASVGMPMTSPDRLTSAPPLLPGLIAAEVWMAPVIVAPGEPALLRLGDRTAERGDDAVGDAAGQAQRVAHGQHDLADPELRRVAELGRGQPGGVVHLDHREVAVGGRT